MIHIAEGKTFLSLTWRKSCQYFAFHRSIQEDEMRWAAHEGKGCIHLYFFLYNTHLFSDCWCTLWLASFLLYIMLYWNHSCSLRPHIISYMIPYQLWVIFVACRQRKAQKQVHVSRIKPAYTVIFSLVPPRPGSLRDTHRISMHLSQKFCA